MNCQTGMIPWPNMTELGLLISTFVLHHDRLYNCAVTVNYQWIYMEKKKAKTIPSAAHFMSSLNDDFPFKCFLQLQIIMLVKMLFLV